jgi:hypothetical protein
MWKLKSTPNDPRIQRSKGSHSSEPLDSIPLHRWSLERQALLSTGDADRKKCEATWSRVGTSIAVRLEFFRGSVVLIENGSFLLCCLLARRLRKR